MQSTRLKKLQVGGRSIALAALAFSLVAGGAIFSTVNTSAAQAAEEVAAPEEVTTDWTCETQPWRGTDFLIGDGTAATFSIPSFGDTGLSGTFKRIDFTQSTDLRYGGSLYSHAAEGAFGPVKVTLTYDLWMNVPPTLPAAWPGENLTDIGTSISEVAYNNPNMNLHDTTVDIPEKIINASASGSSSDAATWGGNGSHEIVMQTLSTLDVRGGGGNINYYLSTDAEAQVCYRYVYDEVIVPVAPVAPVVNPAECTVEDQGKTVWETVTRPANGNGITYSDVTVGDGHVASITATPGDGFVLDADALGAGWVLNDNGTATWTKQLTSKDCAATPVVKPTTPGLATTGSTLPLGLAGGAAVLLLAGLVTVAAAKRRHANQQ